MIPSVREGEYIASLCNESDIINQTTAQYSPQSNGVAKREKIELLKK